MNFGVPKDAVTSKTKKKLFHHPNTFPKQMLEDHTSGLESLPVELLDIILQGFDLSPRDIFALAQTNRSLNGFCVPLLLPSGCSASSLQSDHVVCRLPEPDGVPMIDVLAIAFGCQQFTSLHVYFPQRTLDTIRQLDVLLGLLLRVDHLKELRLIFHRIQDETALTGTDQFLQSWVSLYERLMNLVVTKGCQTFSMENGGVMTRAYLLGDFFFLPLEKSTVFTPSFKSGFRSWLAAWWGARRRRGKASKSASSFLPLKYPQEDCVHWELVAPGGNRSCYFRDGRYGVKYLFASLSEQAAAHAHSMDSLTLGSAIPLLPPCSSWTFALFQHANSLTTLTFQSIPLSTREWCHCMSKLFTDNITRNLRSLLVNDCTFIPGEMLLQYLGMLDGLTSLSIDRSLQCLSSLESLPKDPPSLPELRHLTAPMDYVRYFLRFHVVRRPDHDFVSAAFPQLQSLCVIPRADYNSGFSAGDYALSIEQIFDSVKERKLSLGVSVQVRSEWIVPRAFSSFSVWNEQLNRKVGAAAYGHLDLIEFRLLGRVEMEVEEVLGWFRPFKSVTRAGVWGLINEKDVAELVGELRVVEGLRVKTLIVDGCVYSIM